MAVAIMAKLIRLDKLLVELEKGSRSQIKDYAKKGRILVNGEVEKKTDRKVDTDVDVVILDGVVVTYSKYVYYMLHKPQGVVSATRDNLHETVLDLLGEDSRKDLFPVGRLDIDTEGLLLLTNDGDLAHQLLSPKKHVDKQYFAHVDGELPIDCVEQMKQGITLKDGTELASATLEILETGICSKVKLTIQEGKFHQVKRMFEALGCHVTYLKRLSMGSLQLDKTLELGEYRILTSEELEGLRR